MDLMKDPDSEERESIQWIEHKTNVERSLSHGGHTEAR